jgi:hypothetical protein
MSINLKHSLVLTGMFRSQPANQLVEGYYSVVSCALNKDNLVSKKIL